MPSTMTAQASPAARPMMSPARGRPGGRPSITARGSRLGREVAMAGSVLAARALYPCRRGGPGRAGPVNIRGRPGERPGAPVEIAHSSGGRLRPEGDGLWPSPVGSGAKGSSAWQSHLAAWSAIAPREGSADLTVTIASDAGLEWSAADKRAIDLIRVLAMDAVQQAGSGHPGTAMSLAPAAYLLFQQILRHDPADPSWLGRDRFVLSCGHSSLTLYIQLYLSGYGLTLDDLQHLRQWGSLTPGHPEHGHTSGVETTTGPLGQGIGNAVGMAMAARRERGLYDPDAPAGQSPFDHDVYVFASDGDIEEGISHEVSSLAAHQKLGNLTLIYDDNDISIEDDTAIAKSEDVAARYAAYGWHVQHVDWRTPDGYHEDVQALWDAIQAAKAVTDKPSFINLKTIIGWPAPNKQNTGKAHGSALGADEVAATKEILGFDPARTFQVDEDVLAHTRAVIER